MDAVNNAASVAHGRAVQAVIWGIPAVNYDAMFQAFCAAGGGRRGEPDGVLVAAMRLA